MDVVAATLVGAIVAGFFAITGSRYSNRREHDRWLRQQRLEACVQVLAASTDLEFAPEHDVPELARRLSEAADKAELLGPRELAHKADVLRVAALQHHRHRFLEHGNPDGTHTTLY